MPDLPSRASPEGTPVRLFVYGTLMPGGRYYEQYCRGRLLREFPAALRGTLYGLPEGYPALARGRNLVRGWVLEFEHPGLLSSLDALEGYLPAGDGSQNEYWRERARAWSLEPEGPPFAVWVYRMRSAEIRRRKGWHLPSGSWAPPAHEAPRSLAN